MGIHDDDGHTEFNTQVVALAVKIADNEKMTSDERLELLARISKIMQAHFDDMQNYLSDAFLSLGMSIGRPIDKPLSDTFVSLTTDETGQTFKTPETPETPETP